MTLIWDYTLNWIKWKYLIHKVYYIFSTPLTATDNIKKHNIFYYYYFGDYSPGYRENSMGV